MIFTPKEKGIRDVRLNRIKDNLPERRISERDVVVELNRNDSLAILSIPKNIKVTNFLDILMSYFSLPRYVFESSPTHQSHCNQSILSLLKTYEGCLDYFYDSGKTDFCDSDVLHMWAKSLKQEESSYLSWYRPAILLRMYKYALEKTYGGVSSWPADQRTISKTLSSIVPPKPRHKKTPPLNQYLSIPETSFSNEELFMGLRFGTLWLLSVLNKRRLIFQSNQSIQNAITQLPSGSVKEMARSFSKVADYFTPSKTNDGQFRSVRIDVGREAWKIIHKDPLLAEWQFFIIKAFRPVLLLHDRNKGVPNIDQIRNFLSGFVDKEGRMRRRICTAKVTESIFTKSGLRVVESVNYAIPRPCLWAADWLVHTHVERLLMTWLLATERAQRSGIERLSLSAAHFSKNKSSIQISTTKLRRLMGDVSSDKSDVETMVYKRYSPPYNAYQNWINTEENAANSINGYNNSRSFVNGTDCAYKGLIANNKEPWLTSGYLPLQLLVKDGSEWNKAFFQDAGSSAYREAKAFVQILSVLLSKKAKTPETSLFLSTGTIGQSLVVEKELERNRSSAFDVVESESMGHSPLTGVRYKDGFREIGVEGIIDPLDAFITKVGDEKFKLALNMAREMKQSARKLTVYELKEMCGENDSRVTAERLIKKLDANDQLKIDGEIVRDGAVLIVETDITAAMIYSYIKHLEIEIPKLISTERHGQITKHLSRLIYLHQTLKGFDEKIRREGKELSLRLNFPHPPLS